MLRSCLMEVLFGVISRELLTMKSRHHRTCRVSSSSWLEASNGL